MICFAVAVIFLSLGYFLGRKHERKITIDTLLDSRFGPLAARMATKQIKEEDLQKEVNKIWN